MSRQLHELFLASCGLFSRWGVSISRPGANVEERTFQSPHVFIGNRDTIDLPLQDPQVSRRHAYLQVLPGGLYCFDLGSRDKMHWGAENRDSGWLRPGEGVRIGPYLLNLLPAEHGGWLAPAAWPCADPLTDRISEAGPYAPVVVEVCDGDVVVAKGKMNRVMGLVGRSSECLFHINSPGLSKFHCSLVRTPTGLWVVDLLSRKGTCLNGRRVRSARIHEGDLVQVGKYTLRFKRAAWSAKGSGPVGEAAGTGLTNALVPARQEKEPLAPPAKDETTALEPAGVAAESAAVAPRARLTMVAAPDQTLGPEWSMLVALVTQFNRMQQQMFDQFQESMLMTTRMFTSLHQDQMILVREELEHLRGITSELHSLQQKLDVAPSATSRPVAAGKEIGKAQSPGNGATATAPAAGVAGDLKGKTPAAAPTPKPAPGKTPAGAPPGGSSGDVHGWLNQRISSLQQERQTRWHKLLGLILGN